MRVDQRQVAQASRRPFTRHGSCPRPLPECFSQASPVERNDRMRTKLGRVGTVVALLALVAMVLPSAAAAEPPADVLVVAGTITNTQGKPVKDVAIDFYVDGNKVELSEEVTTSKSGRYEAELILPANTLPTARVEMEATRPSFAPSGKLVLPNIVKERVDGHGRTVYLAHNSFILKRQITPAFWIATLVLVAVYALIAAEVMHRTLAALLGAAVLLFVSYTAGTFNAAYRVLSFEEAIAAIDMNVIFLLMAMMIIVGVLKKTGVFQWMAYKSFQVARGNVFALSAVLMFVTAVISAFLDNVTTMLLIIPVTIEIATTLKLNPVALLMPEVFASNVGGTATLIGDPPNIMIGSYAKLTFLDFVTHLTAICAIGLAATAVYFLYWYKKDYLAAKVSDTGALIARLRDEYRITNKVLLIKAGAVLAITIFLFIVHGVLHMEPSIAALIGAGVLLVISGVDIVEMLEHEIEWPTLVFFMTLFMVVAGAEDTGLIQIIADWVNNLSQGSVVVAILMILWVSALASAIIDNIPFTATMLPIVAYLTTSIPGAENGVLWWALALGACLGGNGTMVGASANVVTVGLAEKAGHPISFMYYLKVAFVPMLITVVLSSVWLLVVMR